MSEDRESEAIDGIGRPFEYLVLACVLAFMPKARVGAVRRAVALLIDRPPEYPGINRALDALRQRKFLTKHTPVGCLSVYQVTPAGVEAMSAAAVKFQAEGWGMTAGEPK